MKDESRENRKDREIAGLAFLPISFLPSGLILSSFPHNSKTTRDTHIPLFLSLGWWCCYSVQGHKGNKSPSLFYLFFFFFLFNLPLLLCRETKSRSWAKVCRFLWKSFREAIEVEHLHLGHRMKDRSRYHHLIVYFCSELKNFAFSTILCIITPWLFRSMAFFSNII